MQNELLKARVKDLIESSISSCSPRFIGFLREEEKAFVKSLPHTGTQFTFFGGDTDCERLFLCVAPENFVITDEAFPITALTITFRAVDTLSHRDILGCLMALGIKRETVGDILIEKGRAVVFVGRDVAKYIAGQIERIGNVGVKVIQGVKYPLPQRYERLRETATVASARVDCVVAALVKSSRNKALELLAENCVTVNSVVCGKATKTVANGDKISVRGYGKYNVLSIEGITRKGRTVLITERYK